MHDLYIPCINPVHTPNFVSFLCSKVIFLFGVWDFTQTIYCKLGISGCRTRDEFGASGKNHVTQLSRVVAEKHVFC